LTVFDLNTWKNKSKTFLKRFGRLEKSITFAARLNYKQTQRTLSFTGYQIGSGFQNNEKQIQVIK